MGDFWQMTPWHLALAAEAYTEKKKSEHEHGAWMMWHGAIIGRMEKPPPLSDFVNPKKPHKGIDESAIIARLKAYQRRRENGDSS